MRSCSSRSKEGRLRAVARRIFVGIGMAGTDWCDGENKEEARAVVVGGMRLPMKEGISGDGTSSEVQGRVGGGGGED